MKARKFVKQIFAAATAFTIGAVAPAYAQKFPEKPVTLYVGFAPGGAADTVARVLAEEMSKHLGERVLVENKSGASGNIATGTVLSAPADGHSLIFAAIHFATNPALGGIRYDPAKDITMISQITSVPVVMLASNKSGLQTPKDVAEAAKRAGAGGLKAGSGGIGTSSHLAMELFKRNQNVPMTHVPYRGGAPANQDLMAGEIDVMFDLMSGTLKSMVDAGKVKAIAVMQPNRIGALPDVKSAQELGLPAATHIRSWQGIAVRNGTPKEIVAKLHQAVSAAANSPTFKARAEQLGSEVVVSKTPEEFQKYYMSELERWSALIKAANIVRE
jgi:tripartite-type tricarboxylate transporter receptor subunit TctC